MNIEKVFEKFQPFETDEFNFRETIESDIAHLPLMWKYAPKSWGKAENAFGIAKRNFDGQELVAYIIEDKKSNEIISFLIFREFDKFLNLIETVFCPSNEYKNKKRSAKALTTLCKIYMTTFDVNRIDIRFLKDETLSIEIMNLSGFKAECVMKNYKYLKKGSKDLHIFGLIADDLKGL